MNKMMKGSVAGAAGVALLMGGFGTYALWSDEADIAADSIESGVMTIEAGATTWHWDSATGPEFKPTGDLVVPGDTVVSKQSFDIEGTGNNLEGTITLDEGSLSSTFSNYLDYSIEVTPSDATKIVEGAENSFAFTAPFNQEQLTAVVTYTFDEDTPAQVAQDAVATLQDAVIYIDQTR